MRRRELLMVPVSAWGLQAHAATGDVVEQALRGSAGKGAVLMFRHALAPGTFDPPGFRLDDCATQRNLNDEGRRQAQQMGAWLAARRLQPARVRSSPWCRCIETAQLAFGSPPELWPALGSPRAGTEEINAQALKQLRGALSTVVQRRAGFEVWVTHMFVFSALLGEGAGSGEAALLGLKPDGTPRVIGRLVT
jgi:Histidine phosphatase superfamily (branch 1)